jgi:class 3 adenylate cyclase
LTTLRRPGDRKTHWRTAERHCAPSQATKWPSTLQSDIFAGSTAWVRERCAAVHEIADWLDKLGMSEYAQRFAENHIDIEVLGELTDADFDRLGVSIGHRRKLLKALAARVSIPAAAPPPKSATESAERRQVTVMFADLVGSTALSVRMDPEDIREIISAYQKCVPEIVQRFSGFVAKYMGDGVLVYFGYPQAHEDDAERAVRAGLQLIQAVGGLKSNDPLLTRVGIATGLVVVGDLIGSGEALERGIVGETPNLAARLQAILPASRPLWRGNRNFCGSAAHLVPAAKRGRGADKLVEQVLHGIKETILSPHP